jgi:hypothetical protein
VEFCTLSRPPLWHSKAADNTRGGELRHAGRDAVHAAFSQLCVCFVENRQREPPPMMQALKLVNAHTHAWSSAIAAPVRLHRPQPRQPFLRLSTSLPHRPLSLRHHARHQTPDDRPTLFGRHQSGRQRRHPPRARRSRQARSGSCVSSSSPFRCRRPDATTLVSAHRDDRPEMQTTGDMRQSTWQMRQGKVTCYASQFPHEHMREHQHGMQCAALETAFRMTLLVHV